ncbi:hypothetical protein CPLU01_01103 [Colletotrichum plurivorum]|uniref:DUF7514 domain-containing protein n=1 Tax=Colletotrichum plurivorum TaxID=2175906 RepID=A0A8H6NPX8_9PEZI|nr:hypothetical protein CPLU01_01103 [Colletotrichum plurivorum]
MPAGAAVRPKLNTGGWPAPRDPLVQEPDEFSPLSTGNSEEYSWEQQKETPGQVTDDQHVPVDININPLFAHPRDSMASMSSDMLEELRKIIKGVLTLIPVQAAHVVQLKNSETGTPIDTLRFSPVSSQNSVFTPAYPSPPPSVADTLNTSSSRERSPEVTNAKAVPVSVPSAQAPPPPPPHLPPPSQSTPPVSPQRGVHFRSRGPPVIHCQPRVDDEDVSPGTQPTAQVELSSVDKAWGVLFDQEGFPTHRLNSVLRGLANFMISEFGPPQSLVVTPEKMLVLYTKYKIESERFQFEDMFKSRTRDALERIEYLYQDLDCQYHLVQSAPRSQPSVPGLTPVGFAKWMVSNILAYPDPEARRLDAIMASLPIDVDGPLINGKAERLPKQLSRHLIPAQHDKKTRMILDEAVRDCVEDIAPPLPAIPRTRSDGMRPPEANTHSRRSVDNRRRPAPPPPHRSRTYDRGSHRVEPHPARLPRANSDAGSSMPRHRDLPAPPMGRHSSSHRQRSPPPSNRYSASLPAIPHAGSQFSASSSDVRGNEGNYGVYSGRDRPDSRDDSPRSPGFGRKCDRGPTWEDVYTRSGTSGARGGSVDAGSQRSFR